MIIKWFICEQIVATVLDWPHLKAQRKMANILTMKTMKLCYAKHFGVTLEI